MEQIGPSDDDDVLGNKLAISTQWSTQAVVAAT